MSFNFFPPLSDLCRSQPSTYYLNFSVFIFLLIWNLPARSDGNVIDKIYHPYVQYTEHEAEYRLRAQQDSNKKRDDIWNHRFSYSVSALEKTNFEFYVIAEEKPDTGLKLSGFELETRIQLTEQGEYWADWGFLIELEREVQYHGWEAAGTVLIEKEWLNWITTANLSLGYEWGHDVKNEINGNLGLQTRYRLSRFLEPAVELYLSEQTLGLGPVLLGQIRLAPMKKLYWETGIIFGLDKQTPDSTIRFMMEFEY